MYTQGRITSPPTPSPSSKTEGSISPSSSWIAPSSPPTPTTKRSRSSATRAARGRMWPPNDRVRGERGGFRHAEKQGAQEEDEKQAHPKAESGILQETRPILSRQEGAGGGPPGLHRHYNTPGAPPRLRTTRPT